MPPEEKSSLGKLEEKLYSAGSVQTPGQSPSTAPPILPQVPDTTSEHWTPAPKTSRKSVSLAVWFLIGAAVFFLIVMGVAAFFLFTGVRIVSNDKIDITVSQGSTNIASGTAVPLTVTVRNRNPAAIINTNVTVSFPDGTRTAADVTQPLTLYTDTFGSIASGASASKTVSAVLFGSVNQTVTIPVTFQYRTANSNQVLTKQEKYTFTITSSPLTITTKTPSSVASGQPFTIQVAVRSSAATPISAVAVAAAPYPAGFTPHVSGAATTTGSLFMLGTLQPGQEKDFTLAGSMTGSDNDQQSFGFTVGTMKTDGTLTLAVPYASAQSTVTITKPFLDATLALNNSADDTLVVSPGQAIAGAVSWANTLASGITNAQVTVKLSGNAFNPSSVTASNGSYDSAHSSVIFNSDTEPSLAHLDAGVKGNGSFGIGLKTGTAFSSLTAPTILVSIGVSGTPDGSTKESIASSLTRTIHVSTDLLLSAQILHSSGVIPNSGAWPPIQNAPTTYTVALSATNDVNDVAGATASLILPSYVTYSGQSSVSSGTITYDDTTRMVIWKIGDIPAGTIAKPAQAFFQISLTPNSSQVGSSPILIQNQTLTGTDRFTNTTVENTSPGLSTADVSDPGFQSTFGTVSN